MVEYTIDLSSVFNALADRTRRDILRQVAYSELSIGEIAAQHGLGFAAISKHIKVLEQAGLVAKRKQGKHRYVSLLPRGLGVASSHLMRYQSLF